MFIYLLCIRSDEILVSGCARNGDVFHVQNSYEDGQMVKNNGIYPYLPLLLHGLLREREKICEDKNKEFPLLIILLKIRVFTKTKYPQI